MASRRVGTTFWKAALQEMHRNVVLMLSGDSSALEGRISREPQWGQLCRPETRGERVEEGAPSDTAAASRSVRSCISRGQKGTWRSAGSICGLRMAVERDTGK